MEIREKLKHWKRRVLVMTVLVLFSSLNVYAWYSTRVQVVTKDGEQQCVRMGMSLDMLFDRLDPAEVSGPLLTGVDIKYNQGAEWGSAENPYIISDIRHLQNLSALQNSGYFKKLYIDQGKVPYFLVCTPNGTPVTVNGENITIAPIGTTEYPFVGFVGGAFVAGDTTVNGMLSDTSVISGLKVTTDEDAVDVGIFGAVGKKDGSRTTVKDLVLSDVCLAVGPREHTLAAIVGHLFSFSGLSDTDKDNVPHENHHIGIFAGHVENADVDHISVYYSNDVVTAMNVQDSRANYLSATGIIGFFDDMNGQTSNSITMGNMAGTGGGTLSGTGRGYMTAKDIAEMYPCKIVDDNVVTNTDADIKLLDAVDGNGKPLCIEWVRNRLLWGTENTDRYYFYDGVFTFALSDKEDTIRNTWDGTPDTFFLGEDNAAAWKKNTSEGTYAVTAFIKPVTNATDLNAAVNSGKPILVSHKDTSNQRDFLLTLSEASADSISSNFLTSNDSSYTTAGTWVSRADSETMQSIFDSFNNNQGNTNITDKGLIVDSNSDGRYDALGNNIEMLNLGASSEEDILAKLSTRYNVRIEYNDNNTLYRYFDADTPAYIDGDGLRTATKAEDYYYYTHRKGNWGFHYFEFYQHKTEQSIGPVGWPTLDSNWRPDGFTQTSNENGISVVGTFNDTTLPLLYVEGENKYYSESNKEKIVQTDPDGNILIPGTDVITKYLKYNVTEDRYYFCEGNTFNLIDATDIEVGTDPDSGNTTYTYEGYTYAMVFEEQMNYYTLGATENPNQLNLIYTEGSFLGLKNRYYSIWCGENPIGKGAKGASEKAVIEFANDGSCAIRYSYGTKKRYVNFNTENFNGQSSESDTTKLYIYTLEGTCDINYGHITFEPSAGTAQEVLRTDEYVLWPNETTDGAKTIDEPTYTVKSLADLYTADNGWQNKNGEQLSQSDLTKKFHMNSEIQWTVFGSSWNVNWGDRNLSTPGFLVAPIGSNGVKANIPQGSVAFRINKAGESRIRVIVALPQSDYSKDERDSLDASDPNKNLSDCYFGLWKVEANGESFLSSFSQNSAQKKFYIPKSEPYVPNISAAGAAHYSVNYGDGTYRLYPNGNRILIAYTFSVSEEGVYILGTTGQPMEIVYFSADGAASGGRDGVLGSALGSIDFVYDYENRIITVKDYETDAGKVDDSDGEIYNNYYASLCLMYTNNGAKDSEDKYLNINNFSVQVQRYIDTDNTQSCITMNTGLTDKALVKMNPYSINSDKVTLNGENQN